MQQLPAEAQAAGLLADGMIAPGEGLQPLGAAGLRAALAAVVVDGGERPGLVLEFEVVPVATAEQQAAGAGLEFQRMPAAEALAEGFATLEVEAAVVAACRRRAAAVAGADQVAIGAVGGPAGGQRQLRVELPLQRPDVEGHGLGRHSQAGRQRRDQSRSARTPRRRDSAHRCQRDSPCGDQGCGCSGPTRQARCPAVGIIGQLTAAAVALFAATPFGGQPPLGLLQPAAQGVESVLVHRNNKSNKARNSRCPRSSSSVPPVPRWAASRAACPPSPRRNWAPPPSAPRSSAPASPRPTCRK
ncbi:hypothetical protein D9M71_456100 [compost metagenome]